MARPKVADIDPKIIRQIEVMAGLGMTLDHIARVAGCSSRTLDNWLKLPNVREAYELGRAQGAFNITKTAYAKAIAGDTTMLIFFLKTQLGWREVPREQVIQVGDSEGAARVIIELPDNGREDRTPSKK